MQPIASAASKREGSRGQGPRHLLAGLAHTQQLLHALTSNIGSVPVHDGKEVAHSPAVLEISSGVGLYGIKPCIFETVLCASISRTSQLTCSPDMSQRATVQACYQHR